MKAESHKYVCDIVIRCKIQGKNYCKLQSFDKMDPIKGL